MKVTAIKCLKCKSIVYSRCRHDFRWCKCESCAIDGGFDYIHVIGNMDDYSVEEINVLDDKFDDDAKRILYDDWNNRKNKFGLIVEENS